MLPAGEAGHCSFIRTPHPSVAYCSREGGSCAKSRIVPRPGLPRFTHFDVAAYRQRLTSQTRQVVVGFPGFQRGFSHGKSIFARQVFEAKGADWNRPERRTDVDRLETLDKTDVRAGRIPADNRCRSCIRDRHLHNTGRRPNGFAVHAQLFCPAPNRLLCGDTLYGLVREQEASRIGIIRPPKGGETIFREPNTI